MIVRVNVVNVVLNRTFDSDDDYCTGCRNVNHCQQQQSYSGLRSLGQSYSTYMYLLLILLGHTKPLACTMGIWYAQKTKKDSAIFKPSYSNKHINFKFAFDS